MWHSDRILTTRRIVALTLCIHVEEPRFPNRSVPLPSAIDDEYLSLKAGAETKQPPEQPSKLAFFIYTKQLFEILAEILSNFYIDRAEKKPTKPGKASMLQNSHCRSVVDLEKKLTAFWNSLPKCLQVKGSIEAAENEKELIFMHQASVLRQRYVSDLSSSDPRSRTSLINGVGIDISIHVSYSFDLLSPSSPAGPLYKEVSLRWKM